MDNNTASASQASPPSIDRWFFLIGLIVVTLPTVALAYPTAYGTWRAYDDEGSLLFSCQQILAGKVLYKDLPGYGPFYYWLKWVLSPLHGGQTNHDINRFQTLCLWILSCLSLSSLVWLWTRSLWLSLLGYLLSIPFLAYMCAEPGHPQEQAALLVLVAVIGGTLTSRQHHKLGPALMGFAITACVLIKINIGVFLIAALCLAYVASIPRSRLSQGLLILGSVLALILPYVLMRRHTSSYWGQHYCSAVTLSLLGPVALLFRRNEAQELDFKELKAFFAAVAATSVITLTPFVLTGTSLRLILDHVLLLQLKFPSLYDQPGEVSLHYQWVFGLSLLLLGGSVFFEFKRGDLKRAQGLQLTGKAIAAFILLAAAWTGADGAVTLLYFGSPLLVFLILGPTAEGSPEAFSFPRKALCFFALYQTLVGYPVFGSQKLWSVYLMLPISLILLNDVLWSLVDMSDFAKARLANDKSRRLGSVALAVLVALVFQLGKLNPRPFIRQFQQQHVPMGLPGAQRLRLKPTEVAVIQNLVQNLQAQSDGFFSVPGAASFYSWTEMKSPSAIQNGNWMQTFTEEQQHEVLKNIRALDRPALTYNATYFDFWTRGQQPRGFENPILVELKRNYKPWLRVGEFWIFLPKERATEHLPRTLQFQSRHFDGETQVLPWLPQWFQSAEWSLSLALKVEAPGPLWCAQAGAPFDPQAAKTSWTFLAINEQGQLSARFSKDPAFTSAQSLKDGQWHHLLLKRMGQRIELWLDGRKRKVLKYQDLGLPAVQWGGGWTEPTIWRGAVSDLSRARLFLRLLNADEIHAFKAEARGL